MLVGAVATVGAGGTALAVAGIAFGTAFVVGFGILIGGLPVVAVVGIGVIVGLGVSIATDWAKRQMIGY